jgi:hypothetical protein
MRVVEGLSEGFGFTQIREFTPQVARRNERTTQSESEIDGLLASMALFRQMRESLERLLEIPHGLVVGRLRHGFFPCLPAVYQRLIPYLPS